MTASRLVAVAFALFFLAAFASLGQVQPAAPAAPAKAETDWPPPVPQQARDRPPGLLGPVGPRGEAKRVKTLDITAKGVYEDYLVDHEYGSRSEVVRIKADGAVLRNCEIRHGTRDAVG